MSGSVQRYNSNRVQEITALINYILTIYKQELVPERDTSEEIYESKKIQREKKR